MSDRYCPLEKGQTCSYYRKDGTRYGHPGDAYCLKYERSVKDIKECKKIRRARNHIKFDKEEDYEDTLYEDLLENPFSVLEEEDDDDF